MALLRSMETLILVNEIKSLFRVITYTSNNASTLLLLPSHFHLGVQYRKNLTCSKELVISRYG